MSKHGPSRRPITLLFFLPLLAGCAVVGPVRHEHPWIDAAMGAAPTGSSSLALVIPTRDRDGHPLGVTRTGDAVRRVEGAFAECFGGFTTITGTHGGWADGAGTVHREDHAAIVVSYFDARAPESRDRVRRIRELAAALGRDLNQESVALFADGRMWLIPPG